MILFIIFFTIKMLRFLSHAYTINILFFYFYIIYDEISI